MELIDLITLGIFFCLGWYCGSKVTGYFQMKVFQNVLAELKVDHKDLIRVARKDAPDFIQAKLDEIESHVDSIENAALEKIDIKVEKHSNTLYAFRSDNDQFLGQGSTKDELIEAMSQKMKNVRLIVVEGNEHMTGA
jgi:hypothetical protein